MTFFPPPDFFFFLVRPSRAVVIPPGYEFPTFHSCPNNVYIMLALFSSLYMSFRYTSTIDSMKYAISA